MKTDKYGIELKVGDYVLLDSYTGMEYGTSAGTIVQIKKIGSRRISFDAAFTNLRNAQFIHCTAYNLVGYRKVINNYSGLTHYDPMFVRTATNEQRYKAVVDGLSNGTDKEISDALIKRETHAYEQKVHHYKLRNSACAFSTNIKCMMKNIDHNLPILETVGGRA